MVADAKEAIALAAKVEATPVEAVFVKGVASSVEVPAVADNKEAGAPDAEGAATPGDSGSVKAWQVLWKALWLQTPKRLVLMIPKNHLLPERLVISKAW